MNSEHTMSHTMRDGTEGKVQHQTAKSFFPASGMKTTSGFSMGALDRFRTSWMGPKSFVAFLKIYASRSELRALGKGQKIGPFLSEWEMMQLFHTLFPNQRGRVNIMS